MAGQGGGKRWRNVWLWANAVGSAGIALVWGIGLSNLLHGVPIDSSGTYTGNLWDLFTGYTVLGGIAFVLLFAFHGATFLTLRTTGDLGALPPRRSAAGDPGCPVGAARARASCACGAPRRLAPKSTTERKCACLAIDRGLRLTNVVPDLGCEKTDN